MARDVRRVERPAWPLPDLSAVIARRLEEPRPLAGGEIAEAGTALAIGGAVLRQLTRANSAPGGASALRGSRIGACARSLAYRLSGAVAAGRNLDARARAVFALGDMAEGYVTAALGDGLAQVSGPGALRLRDVRSASGQSGISLSVDVVGETVEIPGHPDGMICRADTGAALALLEVKSAAPYKFDRASALVSAGVSGWRPDLLPKNHGARRRLVRDDIRPGEWFQAQTYLHALNLDYMGVVIVDKSSGACVSWWEPRSPRFLEMLSRHLERAQAHRGPDADPALAPRRLADGTLLEAAVDRHARTGAPNKGHGRLPWNCVYCPFWRSCWPGAVERVERDWSGRARRWVYAP